jgi:site-specific recombinase XerC
MTGSHLQSFSAVIPAASGLRVPLLVAAAGERASMRFLEFFAANIRNPHTRRAYYRAAKEFLTWCADAGVSTVAAVQPLHVATWVEAQTGALSAPTVKQRLAAIRHLFDWLVTGQVVSVNPAASVRGPRHIVREGKTPVLGPDEARQLLDSIPLIKPAPKAEPQREPRPDLAGLRDRALIGLMVYSFARIGAAVGMKVEDVYTQNRRLWVRLHEKGGKAHAMPCHHNLEEYLTTYLDGAGLRADPKRPLFPTISRTTGTLTWTALPQANAHAMIAALFVVERTKIAAPGLGGGTAGGLGCVTINGKTIDSRRPQFVRGGDRIVLGTPGGGGFGSANLRSTADRERDQKMGYVER